MRASDCVRWRIAGGVVLFALVVMGCFRQLSADGGQPRTASGPAPAAAPAAQGDAETVVFPLILSGYRASCDYWVAPAPQGNNRNPGTQDAPWATLEYAAENVPDDGCTVWFEDGVYSGSNKVKRRFSVPTTFRAVTPYRAVLQHAGVALDLKGARNIIVEGFEFRHSGPDATVLLVAVQRDDDLWAEEIVLRNNIFHDSYNNDLLKIRDGARLVLVENNVFYNQGEAEQQMDVNRVTDVVIQDNIFFNDYEGSGREILETNAFIVVKGSSEGVDGQYGSERIVIRRNVLLNWQGRDYDKMIQIGNDGKPYHEARDVLVENNLFLGNSPLKMGAPWGVSGARDVTFRNNTITGDLPSSEYAVQVDIKDENPRNDDILIYNNIWSDPTGTMGADASGHDAEFADGNPANTINLVLDNNLYWNGGKAITPGDLLSPLVDDARRVVADPGLETDHGEIVLPRWTGSSFLSGATTIREGFLRLVCQYGAIPADSPAVGQADPAFTPEDDITGRPRRSISDLGAFEYAPASAGGDTCPPMGMAVVTYEKYP